MSQSYQIRVLDADPKKAELFYRQFCHSFSMFSEKPVGFWNISSFVIRGRFLGTKDPLDSPQLLFLARLCHVELDILVVLPTITHQFTVTADGGCRDFILDLRSDEQELER